MNTIIGADAAKLAGLQIDTLSKVRAGQITLEQWERFNNLSPKDREARFGKVEKPELIFLPIPEKFALLADLGKIKVPADFDHALYLAKFCKKNYHKFEYYSDGINDTNFSNPSRILKPGDKLHVRAFQQIVGGSTTTEERMDFCRKQPGNIFTGAQGASLVFEQKRNQLPKGKYYVSFDEEDCLPVIDNFHRVLSLSAFLGGALFNFSLVMFERVWDVDCVFFCFCDAE